MWNINCSKNVSKINCTYTSIIKTKYIFPSVVSAYWTSSQSNLGHERQSKLIHAENIKTKAFWKRRPSPLHTKTQLAHGILLSPAPCSGLILVPVCLVHVSNLGHQRIVWIWVRQQRTNRKQHLKLEIIKQFNFLALWIWKSHGMQLWSDLFCDYIFIKSWGYNLKISNQLNSRGDCAITFTTSITPLFLVILYRA